MKTPITGGPAFPRTGVDSPDHTVPSQTGMSLRDWFAGQALAGIVASTSIPRVAAEVAYSFADAMLAERAKGGAQ